MISNAEDNNVQDLRGLSSELKPIGNFQDKPIKNGSTFYEIDTGDVYMYDKENARWILQ